MTGDASGRFRVEPPVDEDATDELQSTIDECASCGGGTVHATTGDYRSDRSNSGAT